MIENDLIRKILASFVVVGLTAAALMLIVTFEAKSSTTKEIPSKDPKQPQLITNENFKTENQLIPKYGRRKRGVNSDPEMPEESGNIEMFVRMEEEPKYDDEKAFFPSDFNEFQPENDEMDKIQLRDSPIGGAHRFKLRREKQKMEFKEETANINSLTYVFANNSVYVIDRGQIHEKKDFYVYSWIELTTAAAAAVGLSVSVLLLLMLFAFYCTKNKRRIVRGDLSKLFLNMSDLRTDLSPHLDEEKLNSVVTKSYIQIERNPSGLYLAGKNLNFNENVVGNGFNKE